MGYLLTDGVGNGGYLEIVTFTTTNADYDLRADITPAVSWDVLQTLWAQGDTLQFLLTNFGTGQLRTFWRNLATASKNSASGNHGRAVARFHVRVTADVDDGGGDTDLAWYYRADTGQELSDNTGWTNFANTTVVGTTGLRDGFSDTLTLLQTSAGAQAFAGRVHQLYLLNGPTEYVVDLRALTVAEVAAAEFIENNGTTVTINGGTWSYVGAVPVTGCAFDSAFDSPTGNGAFCVAVAATRRVIKSPRYGITGKARVGV